MYMTLTLEIEMKENESVNWNYVILGFIYFTIRLIAFNGMILDGGNFHPRIFHTSNLCNLTFCFALMGGLRYKVFNSIPLSAMPTMLISIMLQDIPAVFFSDQIPLYKLYYATVHVPVFITLFYFILARKYLISKESMIMGLFISGLWFLFIDDKENGSLDGWTFFFVGITAHIIWALLFIRKLPNEIEGDAWVAPVFHVKSIKNIPREILIEQEKLENKEKRKKQEK